MSPNIALSGDVGWLSAKLSRCISRLRLWNRLVSMDDERLTKKIFLKDHQICRNNWSSEMKKLLASLGSEAFNELSVVDLTDIEDHLYGIMLVEWRREVVKKPKL